jgi:hypothetical protein
MSILSAGLYLFYWLYITWKQYRDESGNLEAQPVWHALTMVVPIYGFFRMHAHVRVYKEMMATAGVSSTLNPGLAVALLVIESIVGWAGFPISFTEYSVTLAIVNVLLTAAAVALVIVLILPVQDNINRLWTQSLDVDAEEHSTGVGEVLFAVAGVLIWFGTFFYA